MHRHLPRDNVPRRLYALSMRWVLMLFVILAAVMGGEARAVVVMGRVVVSERVGRAETVEKECASFPGATRGMVREAEVAGLEDAGPLALWFPGGLAVARSDCGDRQAVFSGGTSAAEYTVTAAAGSAWAVPSAPTVQHVRGPDLGGGTKGLLYSLRNGLPKFNRYNGRGDVVAQSDIDGTTTWAASYQADGRRTAEAGTNVERHRANTKEEDPTGLLNEGFRYRDMETGTFISRDPLGLVDGPNVYCYVRQNPWTKWDPEGLTGWAIPPQYAESAEYREGFRKGMAGGAKLGLALTAGAVATVVAAPVIAAGATAAGVSGGTATAATVLGSGAAGGYAGNAISNALNDRPVNENWKTATATGALLYGAGHVAGTSVRAFKAGLNSVKSTAPSVGGTAAQTTAEVAAAAKTAGKGLGNPFRGKTAAEIDEMFKAKGYELRGPDPLNGKGGYVNPKNQRSYHIDEANSFGEAPHVDVNRLKAYKGPLEKKKLEIGGGSVL